MTKEQFLKMVAGLNDWQFENIRDTVFYRLWGDYCPSNFEIMKSPNAHCGPGYSCSKCWIKSIEALENE